MKIPIIFLGTPEFAIPILNIIDKTFEVLAVITQPDRPSGRGKKLTPSPVKKLAKEKGWKVLQPCSLKTLKLLKNGTLCGGKGVEELVSFLNEQKNSIAITAAYGNIIPVSLIDYWKKPGIINIHPSLLPEWRGAAPIQRAIFSGSSITGTALMKIDAGLDTGDVFAMQEVGIGENDTFGTLRDKLADISGTLLIQNLQRIISGELKPIPQDHSLATYAEKWTVVDAALNWKEEAMVSERRIRASTPIPGAFFNFNGERIKISDAKAKRQSGGRAPGKILSISQEEILIQCGFDSSLAIRYLQRPGRRMISSGELCRGYDIRVGDCFHNGIANESKKN